ncbi:gamma carbonic anhydrase 1, mitochondrial isoform X2 [Cryptomeria japonica]|uniref:gamma carbonic anhydrase 1, mitochondrial isoform X2 n=1 Tax=Cryptomeria japonica TaxID=3369 RepID=UPI0027DA7624|nr:gamma carbonic anhydrase 1, mitochondrial isoform X2 [Cryptomeria japonica]
MISFGKAFYNVGFWVRETGQALDRLGCRLQGNYVFQEQLSRHRPLMNLYDKVPNVAKDVFVAPSASLVGDVKVGQGSSIWYGCILRGHSAVLHGCTIEDEAFVGMGATLLDGVVVEKNAMVAAGALVRQNARIPTGEVWGGNPAKFLRKLTDEEIAFFPQSASNYSDLAEAHSIENAKSLDITEAEKIMHNGLPERIDEGSPELLSSEADTKST